MKFVNKYTKGIMVVSEERVQEYIDMGHTPIPEPDAVNNKPKPRKRPKKKNG